MASKENYSKSSMDSPILSHLKKLQRAQERHIEISNCFKSSFMDSQTSTTPPNFSPSNKERDECKKESQINHDEFIPLASDMHMNDQTSSAKLISDLKSPSEFSTPDMNDKRFYPIDVHLLSNERKTQWQKEEMNGRLPLHSLNLKGLYNSTDIKSYSPFLKKYPTDEVDESLSKHTFLKKGQGTARFGKGNLPLKFKKKDGKRYNLPQDKLVIDIRRIPKDDSLKGFESLKIKNPPLSKDPFENLEELASHDSFSMNSPRVVKFAEEAERSYCSTPIIPKNPHVTRSLSFSPISSDYANGHPAKTSVGKEIELISNHNEMPLDMSPMLRQLHNVMGPKQAYGYAKDTLPTGCSILKKTTAKVAGSLKCSSPQSTQKVHFKKDGARILEYDNENQSLNASQSIYNDSDLINVSDLEYLAHFNYNVEVVEITNQNLQQRSSGELIDGNRESSKFFGEYNAQSYNTKDDIYMADEVLRSDHNMNENGRLNDLDLDNNYKSAFNHDPRFDLKIPKDDIDADAHKILVMAKVDDLNKEIKLYQNMKKELEIAVKKHNDEKDKLIKEKVSSASFNGRKVRVKSTVGNEENRMLNRKIEEVDGKLSSLGIENAKLKKMVNSLQRKSREMDKIIVQQQTLITEKLNGPKKPLTVTRPWQTNASSKMRAKISSPNVNSSQTNSVVKNNDDNQKVSGDIKNKNVEIENKSTSSPELNEFEDTNKFVSPNQSVEERPINFSDEVDDQIENYYERFKNNGEALTMDNFPDEVNIGRHFGAQSSLKQNSANKMTREVEFSPTLTETHALASRLGYKSPSTAKVVKEITRIDGCREIYYSNGNKKEIYSNGLCIYNYPNGDRKTIDDDKIVYFHARDSTMHTKYKGEQSGKEIIEYANSQIETYYPDGSYRVMFPDKSSKTVHTDGTEKHIAVNGTVTRINESSKIVEFPNGQKEVYEDGNVTRLYPDGTIKTLFSDGSQETRYKNGKIRVKDKDGCIFSPS